MIHLVISPAVGINRASLMATALHTTTAGGHPSPSTPSPPPHTLPHSYIVTYNYFSQNHRKATAPKWPRSGMAQGCSPSAHHHSHRSPHISPPLFFCYFHFIFIKTLNHLHSLGPSVQWLQWRPVSTSRPLFPGHFHRVIIVLTFMRRYSSIDLKAESVNFMCMYDLFCVTLLASPKLPLPSPAMSTLRVERFTPPLLCVCSNTILAPAPTHGRLFIVPP